MPLPLDANPFHQPLLPHSDQIDSTAALTPAAGVAPTTAAPSIAHAEAVPPRESAAADHANRAGAPKQAATPTSDIVAAAHATGKRIAAVGEGFKDLAGGAVKFLLSLVGMGLAGGGSVAAAILGTLKGVVSIPKAMWDAKDGQVGDAALKSFLTGKEWGGSVLKLGAYPTATLISVVTGGKVKESEVESYLLSSKEAPKPNQIQRALDQLKVPKENETPQQAEARQQAAINKIIASDNEVCQWCVKNKTGAFVAGELDQERIKQCAEDCAMIFNLKSQLARPGANQDDIIKDALKRLGKEDKATDSPIIKDLRRLIMKKAGSYQESGSLQTFIETNSHMPKEMEMFDIWGSRSTFADVPKSPKTIN